MSSLRRALSTSVAIALLPVIVALDVAVYLGVASRLRRQVDEGLVETATAFVSVVERDPGEASGYEFEFDASMAPQFGEVAHPSYFQVWFPDGSVLEKSRSLGAHELPRLTGTLDDPAFQTVALPGGRDGRLIYFEFWPRIDSDYREADPRGPVALAVAKDTAEVERTLASIAAWLFALGAGLVVLAGGVAALAVARGLRPLGRFARAIERIDDAHLSTRVDAREYPAELGVPISKLNDLLQRLGDAFQRERRLTADLSHELRTPLAALRNILEVAASREREPPAYRTAIDQAHGVVCDMIATAESLLVMARADAGQVEPALEPVDLSGLVDECWAPHAEAAERRALAFHNEIARDHEVISDREVLRTIVANLLSNAARYTDEGGWIAARAPDRRSVVLEIADSGPPLAPADLERVFDRFWRADAARSAAGTHAGIGLSLVRALCHCLGWSIEAENTTDGGLRFTISRVPRARSPARPDLRPT